MRMKLQTLLFAALALAAASSPRTCAAQAQDRGGQSQQGMSAKDWTQVLGLTPDQERKLDAAFKEHVDAVAPVLQKHRQAMLRLRQQLDSKAPNKEIQATLGELDQTRDSIHASMQKFWRNVSTFLTPTQRARMMSEMAGRLEESDGDRNAAREGATRGR